MKEQQGNSKLRYRRSREESRALTRSKLIKMGRKHFLAKGFAGTVLEQVAEEAGFSRGALYSNFSGKEDLFLAVFDGDLHMHVSRYHDILDGNSVGETRIGHLQSAFIEHVTNRDWGILRAEFELSALRSEPLRKRFIQVHRRDLQNAMELAQKAVDKGDLLLSIPIDEFVLAVQSFMMGLAVKQRLLNRDFSAQKLREIAESFFECFIAGPLRKGVDRKQVKNQR